jgi:hypothetical protein
MLHELLVGKAHQLKPQPLLLTVPSFSFFDFCLLSMGVVVDYHLYNLVSKPDGGGL